MLNRIMAAGLQNVVEADDIGFHVYIRVVNGITNARLRGKINNDAWMILLKNVFNQRLIRKIAADKLPSVRRILLRRFFDLSQTILLQ